MVLFSVKVNICSEKRTEFLQTIRSFLDQLPEDKGCLNTHFYQDVNDKNIFFLELEWQSEEKLRAYFESDHFRVLLGGMNILASHPPDITLTKGSQTFKLKEFKETFRSN